MASTTSVMSLLKAHPISLRKNLLTICNELTIAYDNKDTRAILQGKIDDIAKADGANEKNVKEKIANEDSEEVHQNQKLIEPHICILGIFNICDYLEHQSVIATT